MINFMSTCLESLMHHKDFKMYSKDGTLWIEAEGFSFCASYMTPEEALHNAAIYLNAKIYAKNLANE